MYKNNKQLGEIGERVAIGELSKYGIDILLPMSDNLTFDFVIVYDNKFYKCQVKTTDSVEDTEAYRFSLTSNNWNKGTTYHYTREDYDILICYNKMLDELYVFSFKEVEGKANIYIRSTKPKNNQVKGIIFNYDCILSEERLKEVLEYINKDNKDNIED